MTRADHEALLRYAMGHLIALPVRILNKGNGWVDCVHLDETPGTFRVSGHLPLGLEVT